MLEQHIHVVGGLRLQIGIPERYVYRISCIVNRNRLSDVLRVRTGKAAAVNQAEIGIASQSKSKRDTRQHLYIRAAGVEKARNISVRVNNWSSSIKVGPLEANTGDQANSIEVDGIHHITGTDLLDEVELA